MFAMQLLGFRNFGNSQENASIACLIAGGLKQNPSNKAERYSLKRELHF